jgi:hypothetical protein
MLSPPKALIMFCSVMGLMSGSLMGRFPGRALPPPARGAVTVIPRS